MSHTNSTTNYSLPQFITTDKPGWLTDINGAFSDIDTNLKSVSDTASSASSNAVQALSDASAANTLAGTADAKGTGALASTSDVFDATSTYSVNDVVIYNNLLYICTTAVNVPGPWDASHWSRTTVEDLLNTKVNSTSLAGVAFTGSYNDLNGKPSVNQHDVLVNTSYKGVTIRVIEYYNFYFCEVVGTATETFDWHDIVALPSPDTNNNIGIVLFPYDGNNYRGNLAFNAGYFKIKVVEAAYVQGSLVVPKSLS